MNHAIQPDYVNCQVTCSCGNTFATRSTKNELRVDICGQCHPFYTGRQKFVDTAGRIQRFQQKFGWGGDKAKEKASEKQPHQKKAPTQAAQGEEDNF